MYIGIPHTSIPALEPRFHRVGSTGSTARAVYLAATKKNVLAALNPSEGNIGALAFGCLLDFDDADFISLFMMCLRLTRQCIRLRCSLETSV
jgi:hypothetical protein